MNIYVYICVCVTYLKYISCHNFEEGFCTQIDICSHINLYENWTSVLGFWEYVDLSFPWNVPFKTSILLKCMILALRSIYMRTGPIYWICE